MEKLEQLSRRQVDALRAVYRLERPARGASLGGVATALAIRPPTALDHLSALEDLGLVDRRRGKSHLTARGLACLKDYERHHRVAETLFGHLGLTPEATCRAAREVDLALSHRTVERICRAEGHPLECPHGAPIPPCSSREVRRS